MARAGDRENDVRRPETEIGARPEAGARSNELATAAAFSGAASKAAQRPVAAAGKHTNALGDGRTQASRTIEVERRKLRVEIVNSEPLRQRRALSAGILRAEHD
jgi:hypothetical protein